MTYIIPDNERAVLHAVMQQAESDLKSALAEICKLQNLDPAKHQWPEWPPQANSLRWFDAIREKFPAMREAADEIERLADAIWEYGQHRPICRIDDGKECDCGFFDVLKTLKK